MKLGRIKWFNNEKGYGFITYKKNDDIFIHKSALQDEVLIQKGELVKFKTINTIKGFQAIDVKIVTDLSVYNQNNIFKS